MAQCGFYGIWFLISGKRGTYHTLAHSHTHTLFMRCGRRGRRRRSRRTCSPFRVKRILLVFREPLVFLLFFFLPPKFLFFFCLFLSNGGVGRVWGGRGQNVDRKLYCCCFLWFTMCSVCECACVCVWNDMNKARGERESKRDGQTKRIRFFLHLPLFTRIFSLFLLQATLVFFVFFFSFFCEGCKKLNWVFLTTTTNDPLPLACVDFSPFPLFFVVYAWAGERDKIPKSWNCDGNAYVFMATKSCQTKRSTAEKTAAAGAKTKKEKGFKTTKFYKKNCKEKISGKCCKKKNIEGARRRTSQTQVTQMIIKLFIN